MPLDWFIVKWRNMLLQILNQVLISWLLYQISSKIPRIITIWCLLAILWKCWLHLVRILLEVFCSSSTTVFLQLFLSSYCWRGQCMGWSIGLWSAPVSYRLVVYSPLFLLNKGFGALALVYQIFSWFFHQNTWFLKPTPLSISPIQFLQIKCFLKTFVCRLESRKIGMPPTAVRSNEGHAY